eukprot:TRINITY_DN9814_c0_g1_i1.p1 TRINITY_DN9814_c0_g1~~TRINITY_DN9814_c0_g1_i1.p1  ORF type:complete len:248 (-),score=80.38 TRINITY_DN9814_c0_g1_i1:114-857(-)
MAVHSVVVATEAGDVIFKRYFERGLSPDAQKNWEQRLFDTTYDMWPDTKGETYQAIQVDEKFVVFTSIGEILVILCGSEEYDEVGLSEIMDVILEYMRDNIVTKSREITEANILEQYDKLCLGINEIISGDGVYDQSDIVSISNNLNMKPSPTEVVKASFQKAKQARTPPLGKSSTSSSSAVVTLTTSSSSSASASGSMLPISSSASVSVSSSGSQSLSSLSSAAQFEAIESDLTAEWLRQYSLRSN